MKKNALKIAMVLFVSLALLMPNQIYAEQSETVNYEELFKDAMDLIMDNYLYSDTLTQEELFEAAMNGMFGLLDPYSSFMDDEESTAFTNSLNSSFVGIGVRLESQGGKTVITKVFDGSPALKAGVLAGDYFKTVDGKDVVEMPIDELLKLVLGEEGSSVKITFGRGQSDYTVDIIRGIVKVPSVETENIGNLFDGLTEEQENQIAYISIGSFSSTVDTEFSTIFNKVVNDGAKYLILDLRDNGGGYVTTAVNLAKEIVPEGPIVHFTDSYGNNTTYVSENKSVPVEIVALINENSASATEFVAGAIQDSGVGVLVGETTFGKGVAQFLMPFSNDYLMKLTMEEFFTRDFTKINEAGISPDYLVEIPDLLDKQTKFYIYDKADGVLNVEKILNYLGYDTGTVDQSFDSKTYKAIKQFQKDSQLYSYGVCDFTTQEALNNALRNSFSENDIQLNKAISIILDNIDEK